MAYKKKILTEAQVAKLFEADDERMKQLRARENLPFIKVDRYRRLYYEHRIFEWLDKREKNVGNNNSFESRSGHDKTPTEHAGDTEEHEDFKGNDRGYITA